MILFSAKLISDEAIEDQASGFNGTFEIQWEGEKQLQIVGRARNDWNKKDFEIDVKGEIKHHAEFAGNYTISTSGMHQHIHMDVNCTKRQLEIVFDSDINDDGTEVKQDSVVVINDKRYKKIVKSESNFVMNRNQKTFNYV